jgi:hypothetical protein
MPIEDILKKLPQEEQNAVREWHDTDVTQEKERGIQEYRKRSGDVNKLLTENKKLKGFLKDKLEFDPEGDLELQLQEAEEQRTSESRSTGKKISSSELELIEKKYKKDIDVIKATLAKTEAEKQEANQRVRTTKITSTLQELMKDIPSAPFIIKDFINSKKVDLDESENVIFLEGEERIEVPKALEAFRKQNPNLVVVSQNPGSGSFPSRQKTQPGAKQMSTESFKSLSPVERSAYMKSGGTIYD